MKKSQWLFRLQRFNDGGGEGGNDGAGGSGGSAGTTTDGGVQQNGGGDKGGESKPAVAFSSKEEYDSALQGAVSDFLRGLGLEKADDLKGIVDSHKQKQEAEKTSEQKLVERETDLKNAHSTIQSLRIENAFTLEAIKQGIDPDKLSDAIRLADLSKVEVTDAGKVKNIEKHVTELITSKPWLKADEAPRGTTPGAKPPANQKSTIPNISDLRKLQRI